MVIKTFITTAPSSPVKMAVTPVAVIRHVVALASVLLCNSVIVFLVNCDLKPKPRYLPNTAKLVGQHSTHSSHHSGNATNVTQLFHCVAFLFQCLVMCLYAEMTLANNASR